MIFSNTVLIFLKNVFPLAFEIQLYKIGHARIVEIPEPAAQSIRFRSQLIFKISINEILVFIKVANENKIL